MSATSSTKPSSKSAKPGDQVLAALPTVTIVTQAKVGPTGYEVDIYCTVSNADIAGQQIQWSSTETEATWADSGLVNIETTSGINWAKGTVTLPHLFNGDVPIKALLTGTAPTGQVPGAGKIHFSDWDDPAASKYVTAGPVISDKTLTNIFTQSWTADDTVELIFGLFDINNAAIVGAEVLWTADPQLATVTGLTDLFAPLKPIPGQVWYSTLTGSDGYARIRFGAFKTISINTQASVSGAPDWAGNERCYVVNLLNGTSTVVYDAPTVNLQTGGVLDVTGLNEFGIALPTITTRDDLAFLYFEGSGKHVLGPWNPSAGGGLPNNVQAPISWVYYTGDPDKDKKPHNTPVLYTQDSQGGRTTMSKYIVWGITGTVKNEPSQDVERVIIDVFAAVPDPGPGGWITYQDQLAPHNGLKVSIGQKLATEAGDLTDGHLFFTFYLNGSELQNGNYVSPKRDKITWPDPKTPASWIAVSATTLQYSTTLPLPDCSNYGVQPGLQQELSYVEYYVAPIGTEQDDSPDQWIYGPYNEYRLNTMTS